MNVEELYQEIKIYLESVDITSDGEHLWSNYQEATGILVRLTQIRTDISMLEITGQASPELKKFRTMIIDPTIERFEKIAAYESRKITARQIEAQMDR